jgi:ABC-type Fe3+/spermidine/putrescine transport system ATPase subunit
MMDVGGLLMDVPATDIEVGAAVWWSIAPERMIVSPADNDPVPDGDNALEGTVVDVADMGSTYDIFVSLVDGVELVARTRGALDVEVGARCRIQLERAAIALWEVPGDRTGTPTDAGATL